MINGKGRRLADQVINGEQFCLLGKVINRKRRSPSEEVTNGERFCLSEKVISLKRHTLSDKVIRGERFCLPEKVVNWKRRSLPEGVINGKRLCLPEEVINGKGRALSEDVTNGSRFCLPEEFINWKRHSPSKEAINGERFCLPEEIKNEKTYYPSKEVINDERFCVTEEITNGEKHSLSEELIDINSSSSSKEVIKILRYGPSENLVNRNERGHRKEFSDTKVRNSSMGAMKPYYTHDEIINTRELGQTWGAISNGREPVGQSTCWEVINRKGHNTSDGKKMLVNFRGKMQLIAKEKVRMIVSKMKAKGKVMDFNQRQFSLGDDFMKSRVLYQEGPCDTEDGIRKTVSKQVTDLVPGNVDQNEWQNKSVHVCNHSRETYAPCLNKNHTGTDLMFAKGRDDWNTKCTTLVHKLDRAEVFFFRLNDPSLKQDVEDARKEAQRLFRYHASRYFKKLES